MPTCHCAFKGCTTYTMHCSDTEHWCLKKWLYEHLLAVHAEKELCEIYTKFCSSEVAHRQMWLLAYYMAAVREKEREHMPLIGPSVDRRSLAYVNQICLSKNVEALMCFTCGQIHTHVACWDRLWQEPTAPHRQPATRDFTCARSPISFL